MAPASRVGRRRRVRWHVGLAGRYQSVMDLVLSDRRAIATDVRCPIGLAEAVAL